MHYGSSASHRHTGKHFFFKIVVFLDNFPKQISYHCRKVYHVPSSAVSSWYLADLYKKSDRKVTKFYHQVINCVRYCVTAHNQSPSLADFVFLYQYLLFFFTCVFSMN